MSNEANGDMDLADLDALMRMPPEQRLGRVLRWLWSGTLTPEEVAAILSELARREGSEARGSHG
jgi:hypothetical protein